MFRLLAELKAEVAAWVALSRRGRAKAEEVLGLDEPAAPPVLSLAPPPAEPPAPSPPAVTEPMLPARRRRAA